MTQDTVQRQLGAALQELEAWIATRRETDLAKARAAKANLAAVVQRAAALAAGLEAFRLRFFSTLERIQALDQDALRSGRFAGALGDIADEARKILRRVTDAEAILAAIPGRADAWSEAKERGDLSRRLAKDVEEQAGVAAQMTARMELFVQQIGQFMEHQRG